MRNEVGSSLEPVRRLPQLLAAALPAVIATAPPAGPVGADGMAGMGGPPPAQQAPGMGAAPSPEFLVEALRGAMREEIESAVQRIMDGQVGVPECACVPCMRASAGMHVRP